MTRNILAIATALLAAPALFASAAEACISCAYVPEVVRSSQTSDAPAHYAHVRVYAVEREHIARPAKRIARSEPVAKTVEAVEAAPAKKQASNENSSITLASSDVAARNESSSISVASAKAVAPAKAPVAEKTKEAAAKPIDCKKFFASVGMILTVPCD